MAPVATNNSTLAERTIVQAMLKVCTTIVHAIICQQLRGSSRKIPLAGPAVRPTTTPTLVEIRSTFAIPPDSILLGQAEGRIRPRTAQASARHVSVPVKQVDASLRSSVALFPLLWSGV